MAAKNQPQTQDQPEQPEQPDQPEARPDSPPDYVERLLDTAYALAEEREAVYTKQGRVRTALRAMRDAGALSESQAMEVEAIYPTQKPRKGKDAPATAT